MKLLKISFLIFFLSFSITKMFSQEAQTETINEGSINEQFDFILRKSGNFKSTNGQAYEAVKQSWLLALKSHTLDSLKTIRKSLNDTKIVVNNQTKEISDLKSKLTNTQSDLDKTNLDKDSMALFGLQMSKANYNMLMWSIIAILLALLILFIYKFKNSNTITKEAKKALGEIEEEFDEHRKVALEREQKVRRQLQDEINKQKGI
ncbi:tRNA (guanine-N1)-methyltransferase [Seonamhaeicola maritimus]|uniref:tRNA (Guanine-N1)-methyltransferase n=1 Tax=Seonamhaeicola maritimus TaxID=2591822 RepID=A0A5C7GM71_9FLAO|nr:tRNA (guanine-N1)-methyltransferase [Seonamhaeicola maritimus]TXG39360.1 tRNA (guanine-N1)-methyltransferase [Seonamhaeicola maritimus]